MAWVGSLVDRYGLAARACLEVGSLDVNGSVRDLFCGPYIGVDVQDGPGVDVIADAENLAPVRGVWPVIVSTEMLEHCRRPWQAIAEMGRLLADGGRLLLSCRGYDERGCWPPHEDPVDLWRFSARALVIMCADAGLTVVGCVRDPDGPGWLLEATK